MPHHLTIDESEVRDIEEHLKGVSFQDEHRATAIRHCTSCDIQACPGSGKTTLLVAKLAILAAKWRWRDRGVLVLSHTNVARSEVQKRLKSTVGYRLLSYPHYIETIQSFCNRFLALPHLRNCGLSDCRVDDEVFASYALRLLPSYRKAYYYLKHRDESGPQIVKSLRFEGPELALGSAWGTIPCSLESEAGLELQALKKKIATGNRVFRYDDMYAMGMRYIERCPWVLPALRHRFPWVFIDEMQDTDGLQNRLLNRVFGQDCVVQRLGDSNQAIFDGTESREEENNFPTAPLDLPQSKRFCQEIATFATPLTMSSPQILVGEPSVPSRRHTVFLFRPESINAVLPAFGELLAQEYQDGFPERFSARAIGTRRKPNSKTSQTPGEAMEKLPFCLSDYLPDPHKVEQSSSELNSLIRHMTTGVLLLRESGNLNTGWDAAIGGILDLLHLSGITGSQGRRLTKSGLLAELSEESHEQEFRQLISRELCSGSFTENEDHWRSFCLQLHTLLAASFEGYSETETVGQFCGWHPSAGSSDSGTKSVGTYTHPQDRVCIRQGPDRKEMTHTTG